MPRHINDFRAILHDARRQQLERQMRLYKSLCGHLREEFIAGHRDLFDELLLPLLLVLGQKFRLHLVVQVQMEPEIKRPDTCVSRQSRANLFGT